MSSVQFPIPVSWSGVRLAATVPGVFTEKFSRLDPSFPGTGGQPTRFAFDGPWQAKHSPIPFTRYLPRAKRSGVRSNLRSVNGRTLTARFGELDEFASAFSRPAPPEWQPAHNRRAPISTDAIPNFTVARVSLSDRQNIRLRSYWCDTVALFLTLVSSNELTTKRPR